MGGLPEPGGEEFLGAAQVTVLPELPEALLEASSPGDLQVPGLQSAEGGPLLGSHLLRLREPEELRPGQPAIVGLLQGSVVGLPDPVHGPVDVLGDMELVKDDLGRGVLQMRQGRLEVGLPDVHGDGLDALPLGGGEGLPEAVQALPLPVIGDVQDPARVQIRDHREVAMALGDGLLVHPEVGDHLPGPPGEALGEGSDLDSLELISKPF